MQRLVPIRLRHSDIIFKTAGNRLIHFMDNAQCPITVLHRIHYNTYGKQIINLVNGFILVLHFLIDTEKMLHPAVNLGLYACIFNMLAHFVYNILDVSFPFALTDSNFIHQIVIHFRLQIFQRQIIQFHFYLGNAQSLGNRCINIQRFPGYPLLLLPWHMLKCPHIVQPVSQFNENDPDILCHGKKHLTQVFRLHFQFIRCLSLIIPGKLQKLQLGNAIHQQRHVRTELFFNLFIRHDGIFHHIMQQPGRNRFLIHFQIRQYDCHTKRMDNIWFPRLSDLLFMSVISRSVCFFNQRDII